MDKTHVCLFLSGFIQETSSLWCARISNLHYRHCRRCPLRKAISEPYSANGSLHHRCAVHIQTFSSFLDFRPALFLFVAQTDDFLLSWIKHFSFLVTSYNLDPKLDQHGLKTANLATLVTKSCC